MPPPRTSLITSIISSTRLPRLAIRHAAPLEFLRRPADPDAEAEPVVGQVGHRADLARQQQRVAGAQLHHVGVEPQRRRHRAHRARGDQRIDPLRCRRSTSANRRGCTDSPSTASPCRRSSPAARSSRTRVPLRSWRSRRTRRSGSSPRCRCTASRRHGLSAGLSSRPPTSSSTASRRRRRGRAPCGRPRPGGRRPCPSPGSPTRRSGSCPMRRSGWTTARRRTALNGMRPPIAVSPASVSFQPSPSGAKPRFSSHIGSNQENGT